jgi:hypothetical protein
MPALQLRLLRLPLPPTPLHSRKESMETGGGGDDVGGVRYYYYHSEESIKNLPGYPDGASRAAGKRLFPGRPGSKFWTAGKILSDFFRSRLFLAHFFPFKRI